MLKKTICVLLSSLALQGCVDSHSVTGVIEDSIKFESGDSMLIYDVSIEGSKHSCTMLLAVMGEDLWALENEDTLLGGLACIDKEGRILSGPPEVDGFTWKPVEGGFEFTMNATATEQNNKSEKLNIYTTSPLFVPLTKDLK